MSIAAGQIHRPSDQLARTEIGVKQTRLGMGHVNSKGRSPGTADEDHFPLPQARNQIARNLHSIARQLLDREGLVLRWAARGVGLASSALIPLNDSEVFRPIAEDRLRIGRVRVPRSAVNDQHDRIGAAIALDRDPLFDSADQNE